MGTDHAGGRPVNEKELEMLLKLKADKKETDFLRETSATKDEFSNSDKEIRELRGQLQNSLVLFIEWVK